MRVNFWYLQKPKSNKDLDEDDKEFLKKKKVSNAEEWNQHRRRHLHSIFALILHRQLIDGIFFIQLKKMQEEEAALKKAREALLKGKKK